MGNRMTTLPLFSNMLNPETDRKFAGLCQDANGDLITQLLQDIETHVGQTHLALRGNEFLDVTTAEKIATTLKKLLGKIDAYPIDKQRLVIGAARYFIKSNDAQADLNSLLGFDDDVEVLNYVLVELGHKEMRITL